MIRSFVFILTLLLTSIQSLAVCPVCTIAVGAGVGILRGIGVDDIISGLWVGAFILSSSIWLVSFLRKKNKSFKYMYIIIFITMLILVVFPLYLSGLIGISENIIFGMDKLLMGIIIGIVIFLFAIVTDQGLRKTNKGKVYVPYQKVIIPILYLVILSLIFYFSL